MVGSIQPAIPEPPLAEGARCCATPGSLACGDDRDRRADAPHLRDRDRVRHHVLGRWAADPHPGRGGQAPVPARGALRALEQRLPHQRRAALPRRRLPPGVRDGRVRRPAPGPRPGPCGGGDRRGPGPSGAGRPEGGRRRGDDLRLQEQRRRERQLLRLPRELPGRAGDRLRRGGGRAPAVPRHPAARVRCRPGRARTAGGDVRPQPAGRPGVGGRELGDDALETDHQHPGRAARGPRAPPAAARHRRRLEHGRADHLAQGRGVPPRAAHDRERHRDARARPGQPHPGHPGVQHRRHRSDDGRAGRWRHDHRPRRPASALRAGHRPRRRARHGRPDDRVRPRPVDAGRACRRRGPAGARRHGDRLGRQTAPPRHLRHPSRARPRLAAHRPARSRLPRHRP